MTLSEFDRLSIAAHCENALRQAGVEGIFPTPLGEVLRVAGIVDVLDISDLPVEVAKASLLKRILGAVQFSSRTVFIDRAQGSTRAQWTLAHETTHKLLPWHEAAVLLDDAHRLSRSSSETIEVEANYGAECLLFQGTAALEYAMDHQHGLAAAIALSSYVGASIAATLRYYVQLHPTPMALMMTGRRQRKDGSVPVYLHVSSLSWNEKFATPSRLFGNELRIDDGPLHAALTEGRESAGVGRCDASLSDGNSRNERVVVEAFDNSYTQFFLLRPKKLIELGARITIKSA